MAKEQPWAEVATAELAPYALERVGATDAQELVRPSAEELAELYELASLGDIFALQARAAKLAQNDPALQPFAERLALGQLI